MVREGRPARGVPIPIAPVFNLDFRYRDDDVMIILDQRVSTQRRGVSNMTGVLSPAAFRNWAGNIWSISEREKNQVGVDTLIPQKCEVRDAVTELVIW